MSPSGAASLRWQSAARGRFTGLLAIALLAPTVFAGLHTPGKACFTEARERGRCVPVKQCGYIADTLRQKNHTQEEIQFLYGSVCGKLPDQRVLVCCVSASVAGPSTESVVTATGVRVKPAKPENSQPSEWPLPEQTCGAEASARRGNIEGQTIGYHPWSVLLHYGNQPFETKFPCTGTLISDRFVLTSAGCVANEETRANLTARVGEYDLESTVDCLFANDADEFVCAPPSNDVPVVQVLQAPPGFGQPRNDIALLKLSYAVELSEWVTPICLPSAASSVNETVPLHAASWNQNSCTEAANRHKVLSTFGVTNQPACRRQRSPGQDAGQDFLCVTAAGGPFAVDLGGALTRTKTIEGGAQGSRTVHELIGVLGSATNCANYEGVLLYTKVEPHLGWIRKMLAQLANEEANDDEEERSTTLSTVSFVSGTFT